MPVSSPARHRAHSSVAYSNSRPDPRRTRVAGSGTGGVLRARRVTSSRSVIGLPGNEVMYPMPRSQYGPGRRRRGAASRRSDGRPTQSCRARLSPRGPRIETARAVRRQHGIARTAAGKVHRSHQRSHYSEMKSMRSLFMSPTVSIGSTGKHEWRTSVPPQVQRIAALVAGTVRLPLGLRQAAFDQLH